MSAMRILLLGTGTPKPSLKRMGAGCLVEVGTDAILFDAGPGVIHRLLEAGIPATRVSHLFLSHLHYDHCMDYGRLVLTRWDQGHGRIPELRVFGPAPLSRMNAALFSPEGAFAPDIEARLHHPASVAVYVNRGGKPPGKGRAPRLVKSMPGKSFPAKAGAYVPLKSPTSSPTWYPTAFAWIVPMDLLLTPGMPAGRRISFGSHTDAMSWCTCVIRFQEPPGTGMGSRSRRPHRSRRGRTRGTGEGFGSQPHLFPNGEPRGPRKADRRNGRNLQRPPDLGRGSYGDPAWGFRSGHASGVMPTADGSRLF